jgi:radical SAM enzyme (TIGR01210 family)
VLLLKNRRCPWRCLYCDLWKEALDHSVPPNEIPNQIAAALAALPPRPAIRQVKLYNAGSFFDRAAIPPADFPAIAGHVRGFKRVIVESHPALVDDRVLWFRDLVAPAKLEVAMGLEIADDTILKRLNKRMTLATYRRASEFLASRGVASRAFVIVKPPFVSTEDEAVERAVRSAEFAFECGAGVVSLIPARFGTESLDLLAARGEFSPPRMDTIERALDSCLALHRGRVFVDPWNLRAACEHCSFARRQRFEEINATQRSLPAVECALCTRVPSDREQLDRRQ